MIRMEDTFYTFMEEVTGRTMKRILIIGAIGAGIVATLLVALVLVVMVTPARAQIGRALNRTMNGLQVVAAQAQTQAGVQLKDEKGVLVAGVFQDSPADKAGLARGDIILSVDGTAVNTDSELRNVLSQHKTGDTLKLVVQHGDSQKTVSVTLADPPAAASATPQSGQQNNKPNNPKGGLLSGPYLGIVPIGAGEFQFKMEMKNGQPGAQIVVVATGGPAEKAGLKVGEVIVSVDGTQIGPQNNLAALLAIHKPGNSVKLVVQGTDGAQRTVTITLGDNPQKAGTAYLGVSTAGFGRKRGFGGPGPGFQANPNLVQHPGAFLEAVTQNSPAEKAGLKAGQVIKSVDGKKLDSPQVLADSITGHKPGDKVTLHVYDPQTDKSIDVQVTLGDNPQKAGSAWLGVEYNYFNKPVAPPQETPGNTGTQF